MGTEVLMTHLTREMYKTIFGNLSISRFTRRYFVRTVSLLISQFCRRATEYGIMLKLMQVLQPFPFLPCKRRQEDQLRADRGCSRMRAQINRGQQNQCRSPSPLPSTVGQPCSRSPFALGVWGYGNDTSFTVSYVPITHSKETPEKPTAVGYLVFNWVDMS